MGLAPGAELDCRTTSVARWHGRRPSAVAAVVFTYARAATGTQYKPGTGKVKGAEKEGRVWVSGVTQWRSGGGGGGSWWEHRK